LIYEIQRNVKIAMVLQFCIYSPFLGFLFAETATAATGQLSLSAGYRTDSLDWNIASDFAGTTPNILSELTWDDLQIFQVSAESELVRPIRERLSTVLLGRAAYGWVLAGDNQDSDYAGDNRTLEWSRSNNDAGDGHVLNLEGGIGLRFRLNNEKWHLTPVIGYSYYEQDLVMQDGFQTYSDQAMADAFFLPDGDGNPLLGLQTDYQQGEKINWDFSLRWHKIDFRAEADWNLRTDLKHPVSFAQEAEGDGISLKAGMQYLLNTQWQVGADLSYIDLQADDGLDIVYLDTGTIAGTRLNDVNWKSWALSVSLQYAF
jgi:hypothetical protein